MKNWLDKIENTSLGRLTSISRSITIEALPLFSFAILISFAVLYSLLFLGYWKFLILVIFIYSVLVTLGQYLVSTSFHHPLVKKASFKAVGALIGNVFPVAICVGVSHMIVAGDRTTTNLLLASSGLLFFSMYFLTMPAFHIVKSFGLWFLGQDKETVAEVKRELIKRPLFPGSYLKEFIFLASGTSVLPLIYLFLILNTYGLLLWVGAILIMIMMGLGFLRSTADWYVISALSYNFDSKQSTQ